MAMLRIYQDSKGMGTCRSCGAAIEWAELISGKRHPFNPPIVVLRTQGAILDGTRTIETIDGNITTSHFSSCPQAKEWRKKR